MFSFEPAALDDQLGVWFITQTGTTGTYLTPLFLKIVVQAYVSSNDTYPRGHPLPRLLTWFSRSNYDVTKWSSNQKVVSERSSAPSEFSSWLVEFDRYNKLTRPEYSEWFSWMMVSFCLNLIHSVASTSTFLDICWIFSQPVIGILHGS